MYNKVLKEKDILLSKDLFSYESLTKMNPYMSSSNEYKKLRKLLREEQDKIRYVQGDIMNLEPIKDENYDDFVECLRDLVEQGNEYNDLLKEYKQDE